MPKDFDAMNVEMAKQVIEILISRGAISDESDALQKLANVKWVQAQGYDHVSSVLTGEIGRRACMLIFEKDVQKQD